MRDLSGTQAAIKLRQTAAFGTGQRASPEPVGEVKHSFQVCWLRFDKQGSSANVLSQQIVTELENELAAIAVDPPGPLGTMSFPP